MTSGETLIIILLVVIAYFLYHIAKQLSYITGKRIKISFFRWNTYIRPGKTAKIKDTEEKLPN